MNNKRIIIRVLLLLLVIGTPQHGYSQYLYGIIKSISDGVKERKERKKTAQLIAEQEKKEAELKAEKERKEAELKAEQERKKVELREQFILQNSKLLEDKNTKSWFELLLQTQQSREKREISIQDTVDAAKVIPALNLLYGEEIDESKALKAIKEIADQGNSVASSYYAFLVSRGYRPGFPNGDRIFYGVDWGNNDCLGNGTILHKKNGVLKVIGGKMVFTMNDGTVFTGFFKEQVTFFGDSNQYSTFDEVADRRIANYPELTPWNGEIRYPDGSTDNLEGGESVKKKEENEKKRIANIISTFRNKASKLGQKYGATYVNSLLNTGNIKIGTPLALLQEYITLYNPYVINNAKEYLKYYEPTVRDMMQYGKTAKRVKIVDQWGNVDYSLMVANGKVVAIYKQNACLWMR